MPHPNVLRILNLRGVIPYSLAQKVQNHLSSQFLTHKALVSSSQPGSQLPPAPLPTLIYFTPLPVYTTGRRDRDTALSDTQFEALTAPLYPTESSQPPYDVPQYPEFLATLRGGQTTFHGPGQQVIYPILDLRGPYPNYPHGITPREYVALLERSTIAAIGEAKVPSITTENPGVWEPTGEKKIAALGIHLRRNITSYGVAINIATDLRWFKRITACGLEDKGTTTVMDLARGLGVFHDQVELQSEMRNWWSHGFSQALFGEKAQTVEIGMEDIGMEDQPWEIENKIKRYDIDIDPRSKKAVRFLLTAGPQPIDDASNKSTETNENGNTDTSTASKDQMDPLSSTLPSKTSRKDKRYLRIRGILPKEAFQMSSPDQNLSSPSSTDDTPNFKIRHLLSKPHFQIRFHAQSPSSFDPPSDSSPAIKKYDPEHIVRYHKSPSPETSPIIRQVLATRPLIMHILSKKDIPEPIVRYHKSKSPESNPKITRIPTASSDEEDVVKVGRRSRVIGGDEIPLLPGGLKRTFVRLSELNVEGSWSGKARIYDSELKSKFEAEVPKVVSENLGEQKVADGSGKEEPGKEEPGKEEPVKK